MSDEDNLPQRIQLSRRKGFDLQAASRALNGLPAVNVARPSKWGNPCPVVNESNRKSAVDFFRRLFEQPPSKRGAVLRMKTSLHELRGKNLACWCPPGVACHADVLLELANRQPPSKTEAAD
jgi:hypothetical protein